MNLICYDYDMTIHSSNRLIYFNTFFVVEETYHMIDKCDAEIATWSETGDNFVVKSLDRFAKVRRFCAS